jgi:tetratricopeptide (TPR) repeat protein
MDEAGDIGSSGRRPDRASPGVKVLDALQASRRLRITPELLYQYVRHGAKGNGGRRLECVAGSAARRFEVEVLDAYDQWLREPWGPARSPRAEVPRGVRDYLKVESGGVCPSCGSGGPFQDAHIDDWRVSRSNHHHNLIRLCGTCHARYDEGAISRSELQLLKDRAIERVQARLHPPTGPTWPIMGAPPLAGDFVGRDAQVGSLVDCLASARSLAVLGVGGIGKTQLLLTALRAAALDRPVFWIGVDTLSHTGAVGDLLNGLARDRGVDVRGGRPDFDGVRACIVFDGIERVTDARDEVVDLIERLLADYSDTLVVVTSQVLLAALDFDETLRLGPLSDGAATMVLGSPYTSPALESLVSFADGHPMTLRILRVLLRFHESAEAVLGELTRNGAFAIADPQRRAQTPRSSLIACLELAYDQLSPLQRRLAWVVASSPGGFRPGLHSLEALLGGSADGAIAAVRAWSLLDRYCDDEFEPGSPPHTVLYMLSPVRAFVHQAARSDGTIDQRDAALEFCRSQMVLSTYFQNGLSRRGGVPLGTALMARELPNVLSAFDVACERAADDGAFLPAVLSIGHSTMMTFFTSGSFALGAEVMRRAAGVAADGGALVDAIHFLNQMQTLAEREFDAEAAAYAMAEAELLAAGQTGEPLAMLLLMRAGAAERRGDYQAAARLARESYDFFQELPNCQEGARKAAGFTLARALEFGGRPAEALPYYLDALECAEAEDDPVNRGSILHHIGNCEAYAGRYQAAMHAYRKAGEQHVALGTAEFISNSIGEAGLIVAKLDPLVGLPGKDIADAALFDIVGQLELLLSVEMYGGRNPRVTLRKFIGIVSLALHLGEEQLLLDVADDMYVRFVEPMACRPDAPPDWHAVILFHIQWIIRLLQFLAHVSNPRGGRRLLSSETFVLAWISARAFTTLDGFVADAMASYLRRRRGMREITADSFRGIMDTEGNDAALGHAEVRAKEEGVDLGWLH